MRRNALRTPETMSFHLAPEGGSVTIMGLVEFDSGLISDAEQARLILHSFTDYEGEKTHGS
jgi:hypothetical protein